MSTYRKVVFAAVGCLLWSAPMSAAPDNTRGMALMAAAVDAFGNLARGTGVTNVVKLAGVGQYEVQFDRDVSACFFIATVGPAVPANDRGELNVALRGGNSSAVYIDTNNSDGTQADKPFHLLVFCSQ